MDVAGPLRGVGPAIRGLEGNRFRGGWESSHESDDHSPRIAHTLTACCRCRQVRSLLLYIPRVDHV